MKTAAIFKIIHADEFLLMYSKNQRTALLLVIFRKAYLSGIWFFRLFD